MVVRMNIVFIGSGEGSGAYLVQAAMLGVVLMRVD